MIIKCRWTFTGLALAGILMFLSLALCRWLTIEGNCLERKRERPYHSWENCYHYDHYDGPLSENWSVFSDFSVWNRPDSIWFRPSTNEREMFAGFHLPIDQNSSAAPGRKFRLNFPLEWFSVIRRTGIVALSSRVKSQQHRNRKSHDETLRKPHDKIKYLSNRREQRIQAQPTGRTRNAELAESDIRKHLSQPAIRSLGASKMSSFIPVKSNDRLQSTGKLERNFEMAGQFFCGFLWWRRNCPFFRR